MKSLTIALLLIATVHITLSQSINWQNEMPLSPAAINHGIDVNQSGDLCIAGEFRGQINLGDSILVGDATLSGFVVKIDNFGNIDFLVHFQGTGSQKCFEPEVDDIGNVYVFVKSLGAYSFFDGSSTQTVDYPFALFKFNSDGNLEYTLPIWTSNIQNQDGNDFHQFKMTVNCNGEIVLSFTFLPNIIIGSEPNQLSFSSVVGGNAPYRIVLMVDSLGIAKWIYPIPKNQIDFLDNQLMTDGTVYLVGRITSSFMDVDPNPDSTVFVPVGAAPDGFLMRIDSQGVLNDLLQFDSNSSGAHVSSVICTSSHIYLIGDFFGQVDVDPSENTRWLTAVSKDVFVVALSLSGEYIWSRQFIGENRIESRTIDIDANGNLFISGRFAYSFAFEQIPLFTTPNGEYHNFNILLNSSGDFIWAFQTETSYNKGHKHSASGGSPYYYASAEVYQPTSIDPILVSPIINIGGAEKSLFVAQYSIDGVIGCLDSLASNYNPDVVVENGACVYLGCMDESACNYSLQSNVDNGNCDYQSCEGCIYMEAINFDATATVDDGSCMFDSCSGDLNEDGVINIADLLIMLGEYGGSCN